MVARTRWTRTAGVGLMGFILALTAAAHATPAAPADSNVAEIIDAYLRRFADAGFLSGNVLVARGDSVLYERSFGEANRELHVPFSPTTRSNVASITKPMTIVVAMRLIDEGKLAENQTLAEWIPDFPRGDEITIRDLLNHRAGIPHRVTSPADETVPHTAADMVEFARHAELLFTPGEESVYSSAGYSVLARVLELAGGMPYDALLETYLFEPAGMRHSLHPHGRALIEGRATPYLFSRDGIVNAPYQDLSFLVGAGSVYATARDLFAMMRALVAGRLGQTARDALVRENGLRWNGSTSGYRAWADWYADTDVTVILTANVQSGANDLVRRDVPRIVAGETVPVPSVPHVVAAAVPVETLRQYEGTYELRPGAPMDVRADDGGLYVDQWFLIPTSDTTFFSPQDFGTVTAVSGPDGRVTHFDWAYTGGSIPMRRIGPRRKPE